jgi:hypothetical protein
LREEKRRRTCWSDCHGRLVVPDPVGLGKPDRRLVVRLLCRVLGSLALVAILASCTSSGGAARSGSATVCGYETLLIGISVFETAPSPDPECPGPSPESGNPQLAVTITASNGKRYIVYPTDKSRWWAYWSLRLPAGSYKVVGWGCPAANAEVDVVVKPGQTVRSVQAYRGCLVP